jgi:hypothetical protein
MTHTGVASSHITCRHTYACGLRVTFTHKILHQFSQKIQPFLTYQRLVLPLNFYKIQIYFARARDRFFQHRFNLQVFSIKPEVIQMKKPAGFLKT